MDCKPERGRTSILCRTLQFWSKPSKWFSGLMAKVQLLVWGSFWVALALQEWQSIPGRRRDVRKGRPTPLHLPAMICYSWSASATKTPCKSRCFFAISPLNHFKHHYYRFFEFNANSMFVLVRAHGQANSCFAAPNVHSVTPFGIMTRESLCLRLLRTDHRAALSFYITNSVSKLFDSTS